MNRRHFLTLTTAGLVAATACTTRQEPSRPDPEYDVSATSRTLTPGMKSVTFFIDTSASMEETLDDKSSSEVKMKGAVRSLLSMYSHCKEHNDKSHDLEAALLCFTMQNKQTTIARPIPMGAFNYDLMCKATQDLKGETNTPLGLALAYAERELNHGHGSKYIIMLTDGENNEGNDPSDVYASILHANKQAGEEPTGLYVITFNAKTDPFRGLERLGARVKSAADVSELQKELGLAQDMILETPIQYKHRE
jgi:Mg-chelatase subunit ChlD